MDITSLKPEYDRIKPVADRFREELVKQISQLLHANGITLAVPVESRVKSWESITEKGERKDLELTSIHELDDLVGIRLILLFRRDIDMTSRLLRENFRILSSEDTAQRLIENQFGYQSLHLVVSLPPHWVGVPSFQGCGNLRCEVQIRTLAQHAWASASHELQYKVEDSVPKPLQRSIYRVSALLETVDLEFERLLAERDDYVQSLRDEPQIERDLDTDALRQILDTRLPARNRISRDSYSELVKTLERAGVKTTKELNAFIDKHLQAALAEDARTANELHISRGPFSDPDDAKRVAKGFFFTHTGLIRNMITIALGKPWYEVLPPVHVRAREKKRK